MSANARGWWREPVRIEIGGGVHCLVNNSAQADRIIEEEWPTRPNPGLKAAAAAVRAARARPLDQVLQARARKAFAAAADDAGVLLPDQPRSAPIAAEEGKSPTKWGRRYVLKRDRR